ncbi:MAG: hypothetical protein ACR5K7_01910 [Symbiopectobacterium sp.]
MQASIVKRIWQRVCTAPLETAYNPVSGHTRADTAPQAAEKQVYRPLLKLKLPDQHDLEHVLPRRALGFLQPPPDLLQSSLIVDVNEEWDEAPFIPAWR